MPKADSQAKQLVKGTGIVGILTLLSRLLGFVRDILVARTFGSGPYADAFFVAFRIPNLLRSLVAEGAMTSAFVPVFAGSLKISKTNAQHALSAASTLIIASTSILSILGIIFADQIVAIFAPGFLAMPDKYNLAVLLTRIMMPYIMCVSIVALLNGALNSLNIFGASAIAQVVMNIALIAGAVVASFTDLWYGSLLLAASVVIGGLLQVVAQLPAISKSGLSIIPSGSLLAGENKQILKLMLPAIVGATVYQLSIFLNTLLASLLPNGSVSWLYYADRLTQLPIGIFTISLASVLLPNLSKAHASQDKSSFHTGLSDSLRYTSFVMLPIIFGMAFLAPQLIKLMFERGAFDKLSTMQSSYAVQAYCVGLWAVSCQSLISRAFIAQKDTLTSTLVGILTLVFNLSFSVILIAPAIVPDQSFVTGLISTIFFAFTKVAPQFANAISAWNPAHVGLALSSSLASLLGLILLIYLFNRRSNQMAWSAFTIATIKCLIASLAMTFGLKAISLIELPLIPSLILSVTSGLVCYAAFCFLLKVREFQETLSLILRLSSRRSSSKT